jgi:hypothetical protein
MKPETDAYVLSSYHDINAAINASLEEPGFFTVIQPLSV